MTLNEQQRNDLQALQALASEVSASCPDLREQARQFAKTLLERHQLASLEPDQVYFHRFHGASSSPRTFSGWQHLERPYQSMTLPQLVIHRFDANDQDNADLLGLYGGFYREGPDKDVFDERNEVALAPGAVLEELWAYDFASQYQRRLDTFWTRYADAYRILAKAAFLAKVLELRALGDNPLSRRCVQAALALTGRNSWPASLEQLREEVRPATNIRLHPFDIGGHVASDILRIELDDGQQLLYLPGEHEALRLFVTPRDLHAWVLASTRDAHDRARFMSHFPLSSHAEHAAGIGLEHLLEVLRSQWDAAHPDGLNRLNVTLQEDAFSHLRDAARQRMNADAHFALRSNADLRKQMWLGYLGAFDRTIGPLAALDWPVALAGVGAGLAQTGLAIDQAVNGHTTAERQRGFIQAMLAAVDTLFDVALLASARVNAAGEMELGEAPLDNEPSPVDSTWSFDAAEELEAASVEEIHAWVPETFRPSALDLLLQDLASNDILSDAAASGDFKGIVLQDGKHYAMVGNQVYQVRHVGELDTWVIIDPRNPYAFSGSIPIIQDAEGHWQPIERLGLKGGTPRFLLKAWGRLRPRPALAALDATPYEVPPDERQALRRAANGDQDRALSDPDSGMPYERYRQLRDRLDADAQRFFSSVRLPARPAVPDIVSEASHKQIIRALYASTDGLVLGENHFQRSAKKFLVDNMRHLKNQGVRVLYLEHFMTDFQQADLDLFNRTGTLTDELKVYVEDYDFQSTLGRSTPYTIKKMLYQAHRYGIRLQGIDCMASYRQAWYETPSMTTRQRMMNYYAHQIIEADQARRGASKWVAFVGNTHANDFQGVPGVAELEGGIGMRLEDIDMGERGWIGIDPGRWGETDGRQAFVKNDLLLRVPVAQPRD